MVEVSRFSISRQMVHRQESIHNVELINLFNAFCDNPIIRSAEKGRSPFSFRKYVIYFICRKGIFSCYFLISNNFVLYSFDIINLRILSLIHKFLSFFVKYILCPSASKKFLFALIKQRRPFLFRAINPTSYNTLYPTRHTKDRIGII